LRLPRRAVLGAEAAVVLWLMLTAGWIDLAIAVGLGWLFLAWRSVWGKRVQALALPRLGWYGLPLLLALVLVLGLYPVRSRRDLARMVQYGGVYHYTSQTLPPHSTIAYLLSHRAYFFYGSHLSHQLFWGAALPEESLESWRGRLLAAGATLLAMGPVQAGWQDRPEYRWVVSGAAGVEVVLGADPIVETVIYRLLP
jgi:hypothetical protein